MKRSRKRRSPADALVDRELPCVIVDEMLRGAATWSWLVVVAVACDAGTTDEVATDSGRDDAPALDVVEGSRGAAGGRSGSGGALTTSGAAGTGGATQAGGAPSGGGTAGLGGAQDGGGQAGTGGTSATGGVTYATDFERTESPLSESGVWHHDGLDWTVVDTASGIAFGTQTLKVSRSGPGAYDDSYAYLSGFPPDHRASAVVHLGSIDASCTHEVEILLRWADSAHVARGYECNLAFDGSYAQIVRWNGAVGDFTYLNSGAVPGGVHEGDTLSASIIGTQINLSVNGVVRASAQDSTFTTGNPGIAFWRGMSGCGSQGDFGFTSFTASAVTP